MVESSDAGEVMERVFIIIWSSVLRRSRILKVESSVAGEVMERLFIIVWSSVLRRSRILVVESSEAGEVMERFFHNRMVLCSQMNSYVDGWVIGCR